MIANSLVLFLHLSFVREVHCQLSVLVEFTMQLRNSVLGLVGILQLDAAGALGVAFTIVQKPGSYRSELVSLEEFNKVLLVRIHFQIAYINDMR